MTQPNSTHNTTSVKRTSENVKHPIHQTPPRRNKSDHRKCPKRPTKRQRPLFGSTTGELPDGYQTPLRRNKSDHRKCPERPERHGHQLPFQPFLTFPPFPFPSLD